MKDQSTQAQRQRLLIQLRKAGSRGVTTIEAREDLDVMMPGTRIFELRHNHGFQIQTIRDRGENAQGNTHSCARYILISENTNGGTA